MMSSIVYATIVAGRWNICWAVSWTEQCCGGPSSLHGTVSHFDDVLLNTYCSGSLYFAQDRVDCSERP